MKKTSKKKLQKKKTRVKKWVSAKESGFYDPLATKKVAKVRVTTFIDSDVLNFLKQNSSLMGEGYQTLMNRVLRENMSKTLKAKNPVEEALKQQINSIIENALNISEMHQVGGAGSHIIMAHQIPETKISNSENSNIIQLSDIKRSGS